MMTRRDFAARFASAYLAYNVPAETANTPKIQTVLARIKPPRFPDRGFDVTKYGAVGDGQKKCTGAIRQAITDCSAAGGGYVVIPQGTFLTGALRLENNVNLHLTKGATLLFSTDPADYLPLVYTRFESTECMNYSPFIYAFEKENIAVTGDGLLDGQADTDHWWNWARKARAGDARGSNNSAPQSDVKTLVDGMGNNDVPVEQRVFGPGHYLRPNFVQPYRCTNVLFEGFSVKRSPMWEINPTLCRNVTVRNLTIDSHGPNNDGCDPDACSDVLIEKCTFSTGDDCIAIKAGRNRDGRRVGVSTSGVIVQDCAMKDGHGGVSIGSEVSGGIKTVFIRRCEMSSPHLQRALRIKTNSYRGGVVENVAFEQITVGQVAEDVVAIDFFYEEGEGGPFKPMVESILIRDVTCQKSKHGIYLAGYKDAPIADVTIAHCTFNNVADGNVAKNVRDVRMNNVRVNGAEVREQDLKNA